MPEAYSDLPSSSPDGRARAAALAALAGRESTPTTSVIYVSTGRVLIAGEQAQARAAAAQLGEPLVCTVGGAVRDLHGYLGAFQARLEGDTDDIPPREFDLVLDLSDPPLLPVPLPPPGYYPANSPAALEEALAQLPAMCGEYEKPRYFKYNPDICARGASGIVGCTRCVEVCPTGAISVAGDKVAVDPFLCQGAGPCVSACPSGAMGYQYPQLSDVLSGLAQVLGAYREAKGTGPVLLLHDGRAGAAWVAANAARLPEHVIPLELEEVASVGMDGWLCALAYGACAVAILAPEELPATVRVALAEQVDLTRALLAGMGIAGGRLALFTDAGYEFAPFTDLPGEPVAPPARFASLNEKRTMIRLAVDHLAAANPAQRANWSMPAGAPFGEVVVDNEACTLCLACASVCPMRALTDGQDVPELNFTEWNCVQCGVCASACPEGAISLRPRFLFDAQARLRTRSLKREEPFCCIACGKPFATQSLMDRITSRLRDHSMFQDPRALRRLQMCEDCRVRDMYLADSGAE